MDFAARWNSFAVPRSPGFRKSKSDQRSPSRFSTGVPVSASFQPAGIALTARVCFAAGFLIACASSSTTLRQRRCRIHGVRRTVP